MPYTKYKPTEIPWMPQMPEHWELVGFNILFKDNKVKNKGMKETLILSLSYGNIIRKKREDNFGLIPESFETYQIVYPGYIVLRLTDLQNDKRSLRVGYVRQKGIITSAYTGLIPGKVDSRYYFYLLHYLDIRKYFYSLGGGVRQTSDYNEIKKQKLPLPSLDEQSEIAHYLDAKSEKINRFIEKKERLIVVLKEQKQAIINELLEDKDETWQTRKLKYFCRMQNGFAFDATSFRESGVQIIKIGNLYKNQLDLGRDATYVNTDLYDTLVDFRIAQGDILISLTGTLGKKDYGYAVLVDSDCMLLLNQRVAKLTPDTRVVNIAFFIYSIWGKFFLDQIYSKPAGTKQANLSNDMILNSTIFLPTLEEQIKIAAIIQEKVEYFDKMVDRIEAEIEKVKELKQSLIAEVVTGKIKII